MVDSGSSSLLRGHTFTLIVASVILTAVVVGLSAAFYLANDILIILLLAVLFAIFLTKSATWVSQVVGWGYQLSLAVVVIILLTVCGGATGLLASRVQAEIVDASQQADSARDELRRRLEQSPAVETLLRQTPVIRDWINPIFEEDSASEGNAPRQQQSKDSGVSDRQFSQAAGIVRSVAGDFFSALTQAMRTTLGLLLNSLIIFFVGLFLAIAPTTSRDGIASFAPQDARDEWRRVLDCLGDSLWRWLIGRFASMLVTGLGVGIALALLGVPMAATLGIITGLLTFIPNIGAAIALALAVFMAVPSGLATMSWVVVIYLAFQLLESYAITPLIQQYQVSVAPALLIGAQAVLGVLLGFLGAMVASPIVVVCLVLKTQVYDKHYLANAAEVDGSP